MSFYETTYVDVAPSVPLLSEAQIAEIGAFSGQAVMAGGAVVAGAAAVTIFGAGWVLYQTGNLMYNEMERAKRETEERERREQILREQRLASAKADRSRIEQKMRELMYAWQQTEKLMRDNQVEDYVGQMELTEQFQASFEKIEKYKETGNPDKYEQDNGMHWALLSSLTEQMEMVVKEVEKAVSQMSAREETTRLLQTFSDILKKATFEKKVCGQDVKGRTAEEERIRLIREEARALAATIRYALEREADRYTHMPVDESSKNYLKQLFDGMEEKIRLVTEEDLTVEELAILFDDLKARMEQYHMKAAELDEDEEYFICTYQAYQGVCKALLEEVRPKESFHSVKELDETMAYMEERVARMEECARIYGEMGKDAYICHAFDTEMKKLGYKMVENKEAKQFIIADMKEQIQKNEQASYFELPDGSLSQVYKITEETYVEVIIRKDGMTSMETFTVDPRADREKVIKDQKAHCAKHEKLSTALKKNWFILTDIEEVIPPEEVVLRGASFDDTWGMNEEEDWGSTGAGNTQHMTFD